MGAQVSATVPGKVLSSASEAVAVRLTHADADETSVSFTYEYYAVQPRLVTLDPAQAFDTGSLSIQLDFASQIATPAVEAHG